MSELVRYDERFSKQIDLRNGEKLRLRLVRPDDKALLRQGFLNLSPGSRHKRFMGGKSAISDAELRYFTEVDQVDHFAIGAVLLTGTKDEGRGIGIARFIRLHDDRECAEVAITVVDDMQGHGVGRHLLEALVEGAIERDIKRFRFECLPHNLEMQRLVRKVCEVVDVSSDTGVMVAEVDLPGQALTDHVSEAPQITGLLELMRGFATEALEFQANMGFAIAQHTLNAWRAERP